MKVNLLNRYHLPGTALRLMLALAACTFVTPAKAQRKVTPVNTPQTATQPINEFKGDTARINARMRAQMKHYHDADGNIIYIDTVTGKEWRDTLALNIKKREPMKYPLMESASVGVDLWNPLMRAFGQHYGLIDFSAHLSLHNRYKPVFETGLGIASNTPVDNNFTYKSPMSVYFRIGADYNFLYNSTPSYQYFLGVRYGISNFSYRLEDISIYSPYWDETAHPSIPSQRSTVGWGEFAMGLRVNLWGPISAGWTFRYHTILHESKQNYGAPWYIPGYGSRGQSITGSFSIFYTLPLNKKDIPAVNPTDPEILLPTPITENPFTPGITSSTSQEEQSQPVQLINQ